MVIRAANIGPTIPMSPLYQLAHPHGPHSTRAKVGGHAVGWRARSRLAGTQTFIGWPMPMACTQPRLTLGHPRTPLPRPTSGTPYYGGPSASADQWGWAGTLIGLSSCKTHPCKHKIEITKLPSIFPDWSLLQYMLRFFALFPRGHMLSENTH